MELVSSDNGKVVVRVHYSAYKNKYSNLPQVRGSYNAKHKTIDLSLNNAEREYDMMYNEGGEGYNPYRDGSAHNYMSRH